MVMTKKSLLKQIDQVAVETAIKKAEVRTSGEICVSVSRLFWGDVRSAAEKAFVRLGITNTADRNGILFFIVPGRRTFVVLGDRGIHEKVGDLFWQDVATALSERFKQDDFTGGLVKGIELVGERLAEHFPYNSNTDRNELSDSVDFG